jgi:hypothetical protein
MSLGTVLTLFVVPTAYLLIARQRVTQPVAESSDLAEA